jgi:RNA polymerase sigma-70 factor, ECF subfamily
MTASEQADSANSAADVLATSRSLLARARQRDDGAWEKLVELYAPLAYFWCRRGHVAEQDIPDVVQEVFRSVVVGIDTFRKERPCDTFRGWLRTVTRSKLCDYFRSRGKSPGAPGGTEMQRRLEQVAVAADEEPDGEEESAERALFFRGLETIRGQFEPRTWQAFWRVVVDEKSVADVAGELGMRPGTVRVAKCRVLHRLRQELGDVE